MVLLGFDKSSTNIQRDRKGELKIFCDNIIQNQVIGIEENMDTPKGKRNLLWTLKVSQ